MSAARTRAEWAEVAVEEVRRGACLYKTDDDCNVRWRGEHEALQALVEEHHELKRARALLERVSEGLTEWDERHLLAEIDTYLAAPGKP